MSPEDMQLAILLSMCPTDLEKELTAQQHLFPDCAQLMAHIVAVINSRTRGLAATAAACFLVQGVRDVKAHRGALRDVWETLQWRPSRPRVSIF